MAPNTLRLFSWTMYYGSTKIPWNTKVEIQVFGIPGHLCSNATVTSLLSKLFTTEKIVFTV
jgi:hypothetical protein